MSGRIATWLLVPLALVAFAANSVICRAALGGHLIDGGVFATIRLSAGAVMLLALCVGSRRPVWTRFDLVQPAMLFLYAMAFSLAYLSLSTGTGALILFGCVQATMVLAAFRSGERIRPFESLGLVVALLGLGWLVAPGLTAPSPIGSALMAAAGVAWGIYSLRGRRSVDAVGDTTRNFLLAAALALIVGAVTFRGAHASARGAALAVASGAIASGLGYVVWFAALRGLTAIRAAIVQLAVPVIAAAGGVLLLSERISPRLVLSGILILGGVGLATATRSRSTRAR